MPVYALDEQSPSLPEEGRYWVAPDAHLIGKVTVGEDVSLWFGAVVRGDNEQISIGARTNLQEGVMVHADPGFPVSIGADCTIGHHAIVHGCTIGDGSLIGMGATVLNGAKIGKGCLVGANALVTEGKEFPDNSLIVGSPARVVRTLNETSLEGLKRSAGHYVANGQRFRKGLKQIG
ncbi:bacterial transferase hexapeptide repeat protein [Acetobacteraceae bacterium AT-5844]|nr:bacterial transferase hexapeptide repeat protein [Acetobacteraceae bacterium AT-5844]